MENLTKIIIENEKLIYSIINHFSYYNHRDDLYQAGIIGLINAYKKFDNSLNTKFTTYAYPFILGEMRKLVREDKGIKISREISKMNLKIEKAYILLTQILMREPSITEISKYLEISEYCVSEALMSLNKLKSIDDPINKEGRELTLKDIIGNNENIDDLIFLKDCLTNLSQDEFNIIENRYMNGLTQSETSKIIGISQVQVSRKEQKVLEKLHKKMVA